MQPAAGPRLRHESSVPKHALLKGVVGSLVWSTDRMLASDFSNFRQVSGTLKIRGERNPLLKVA